MFACVGPRGGRAVSGRGSSDERALSAGSRPRCGSGGASEAVDLDVGGRLFRAGASTLRKAPFFEALLRHREEGTMDTTTTSSGVLFIDRSPDLFPHVLEFLRSSFAYASSDVEMARIRAEFRFFGLDPDAIQPAPGSRTEEVVLGVRWKHVDMSDSDRTKLYCSVHGPGAVLELLWDAREEMKPGNMELTWERFSRGTVLCTEIEQAQDVAPNYSDVSKLMAGPLSKLWELDFRESGRQESSTLGYDSKDDARVHWVSETVTLRRQI